MEKLFVTTDQKNHETNIEVGKFLPGRRAYKMSGLQKDINDNPIKTGELLEKFFETVFPPSSGINIDDLLIGPVGNKKLRMTTLPMEIQLKFDAFVDELIYSADIPNVNRGDWVYFRIPVENGI
jgi:hypothetical protein